MCSLINTQYCFPLPSLMPRVSSCTPTNLSTILLFTLRLQPLPLSWALEFYAHYLIFLGYLISISSWISSRESSCFPPKGNASFHPQYYSTNCHHVAWPKGLGIISDSFFFHTSISNLLGSSVNFILSYIILVLITSCSCLCSPAATITHSL